ncbi:MAG: enoyl-CoA hydratase-related protein [Proteobacteria bacterium]|nr:enoyl-CoA hydratase-related protein [Pseudomonadota bacterium]
MYQEIKYDVQDPIAVITMNRPDRLNAMTTHMLAEIRHALASAEADGRVVGMILTGEGRGFCAGMDIDALDGISKDASFNIDTTGLEADPGDPSMGEDFVAGFTYMLALRKPLLAAINGPCAGLGFCFAMLSDMRFVDANAKFSTAFSQRGLVAEHAVSWLLHRLIGSSRALDLLWSARKFDGVEAERLGIADRLCEPGTSLQTAKDYIAQLAASASPTSLKIIKQQVYRHMMMPLGPAMSDTQRLMDESLTRPDFKEGVRSFIEGRPPSFDRIRVG